MKYLELDRDLIAQALTSDQAYQIVSQLCNEFGSRFAGTNEEQGAARYLSSLMEGYGLEDVHLQSFAYRGWKRGKSRLFLCQDGVKTELSAISLPYSPSGTVEAEVVDVGDGAPEDFSNCKERLPGRVALISARRPVFKQASMHRKDKYLRAVEAGASAVLWMREVGGHLEETGSLPHDAPIPGVGISRETGFLIQRASIKGAAVLLLCENSFMEVESCNVEGTIPGTSRRSILVGAHYDGHDIGQGALDNGAGTAVILETARLLNPHRENLLSSIRFVCFAAEEIGLLGSKRYVEEMENGDLDFMLNLDGGAGRPGLKMGMALQNSPEMVPFFKEAFSQMQEDRIVAVNPGQHSDMYSFSAVGIPSGYFKDMEQVATGRSFGHTRADTLDKVDAMRLQEDALLLSRILLRLSCSTAWPEGSSP